jgi:hypothetical protein
MTVVTFLSGVQLLVLGVIGEYLGRMYEQVKGRPLFIIDEIISPNRVEAEEGHFGRCESRATAPELEREGSGSSPPVWVGSH